jgi:acyl-CoA synthetase
VCLAVVARPGTAIEPEALLRRLDSAGLPRYDLPELILPLSEMPLTATGKILKRELARWVAEGRVRPVPVRLAQA